ncbi:hypothetical protein [Algibacter sp. 2305UL17-15]|uniref:hypothetical protein n=1 Tax=Algibacter sp. 2305UL17-15 TaxID=3231268 RepID=UPI00345A30D5
MNLKIERKIKFWLSAVVKVLIIVLIVYKLIPFVKGKRTNNDSDKTTSDTLVNNKNELNSDENNFNKTLKIDSINTIPKTKKATHKSFKISEVLKYKGRILKNAYFIIGNCNNCSSTITGIDGIANLDVPLEFKENDIVRDFYIYAADTLIYHKAMRLSNLQFNKY